MVDYWKGFVHALGLCIIYALFNNIYTRLGYIEGLFGAIFSK